MAELREVLFEFRAQGRFVKVIAIDPITGTEVTIVGDSSAPPRALKQTAINKLKYVLSKDSVGGSAPRRRDDNLY